MYTDKSVATRKHYRTFYMILIIVALLGVGVFFAVRYVQSSRTIRKLQQAAAQTPDRQANDLVRTIGMHMVLPNEKPTIATVEDTKKLSGQTFFQSARNGDKVLIYAKAQKAVLYRPSISKVIEVAHVRIDDTKQ